MKYENAIKGIKKIYLAEILALIGAVFAVFMLAILAVNKININGTGDAFLEILDTSGMMVPFILYSIGTVLMFLISFIIILTGLIQGSHDEENFRRALWVTILAIGISVLGSALQRNNPQITGWLEIASTICSMMITLLVLNGIGRIADDLGNKDVSALSAKCSKIVLRPFILSAVLELLIAVIGLNETAVSLLSILIYLLDAVAYVLYLRVLSKARVMQ